MNVYDKVNQYGLYGLLEGANRQSNGDTFFVDSATGSNGTAYGSSWDAPYATVNYAVSKCTSGNGDIILVAAGHAETITATSTASGVATGQFCIDKGDVTILGMGRGTRRPTFTFTTAAAAGVHIVGSNPNITLANLLFISDYTGGITSTITASANNYGLTIENCEFRDDAANTVEYLIGISLAANIEDVTIRGCKFVGTAGGDSTCVIKTAGDADRLEIYDNFFRVDTSAAVLDLDATAIYDVMIRNNVIYNVDAAAAPQIDLHDSSTGFVMDNVIHAGLGGTAITAANCVVSGNTVTSTEGASAQPVKMLAGPGGTVSTMGVYYVDDHAAASDSNNGLSWETAFATIQVAIDACTANNGDTIYVGANYVDNIDGTVAFDVDCDGISIIGMGNGNDRPTFTMITSAPNAQVYVTGIDCKLENLRFIASMASLAELVNINADGLQVINCHFGDDGADEALSHITIDTTDDKGSRTLIKGCTFDSFAAGATNTAIYINKDIDDVVIEDNTFRGEYDDIVILSGSASHESENWLIQRNDIENSLTGVGCISIYAGVTGIIRDNTMRNDDRDEFLVAGSCNNYNNVWMDVAADAGVVRVFDDETKTPGSILFVDSGATNAADTAGCGMSWDQPLATLDAAIALCVANAGSEIHLAPGHTETYAAAGANLTLDVVGISIIGHGNGTDRPTFTFTTETTADINITAANVTLENIIFIGDVDGLAAPFHLTAANFTMRKCVFRDLGADNCLIWVDGSSAADDATFEDCVNEGTDTAGNVAWISMDSVTRLTIKNCVSNGDFSNGNIETVTGACTDILITGCHLENKNAVDVNIDLVASTTGWISYNSCMIVTDGQVTWIDGANCSLHENYGVNAVGETGMIIGTASSA